MKLNRTTHTIISAQMRSEIYNSPGHICAPSLKMTLIQGYNKTITKKTYSLCNYIISIKNMNRV